MEVIKTGIKDCFIIEPKVFGDKRGYFFESFNKKSFSNATGINVDFIQDNESLSFKGVLRGLHFQRSEYAQAKLVRVIKGEVLDVAVDIRKGSKTFGEKVSLILSEKNKRQLFIPKGFAHGFVVLSDEAIFSYKCDNYYNKAAEGGVIYNDSDLDIDWKLSQEELLISDKDKLLPTLKNLEL